MLGPIQFWDSFLRRQFSVALRAGFAWNYRGVFLFHTRGDFAGDFVGDLNWVGELLTAMLPGCATASCMGCVAAVSAACGRVVGFGALGRLDLAVDFGVANFFRT